MTASQLVQFLTQVLFVVIFLLVSGEATRRWTRAGVDTALLFGVVSLLVAEQWITEALGITPGALLTAAGSALLMSLPYLLVRLVDDFTAISRLVVPLATFGLALAAVSLFLFTPPYPGVLVLLCVLYFAGFIVYAARAFVQAARRSTGVTKRRMQAVAAGALLLGLTIILAGLVALIPALTSLWAVLSQISALAAGLGFFLGFTPPAWLRRTWQEPEVRALLSRSVTLPRLPDTGAMIAELQRGAAQALGVERAAIGLWDEPAQVLRFDQSGTRHEMAPGQMISGRAFLAQRPTFSADAASDDAPHAELYRAAGTAAIMAAPITADSKRLGVLSVYASRAPLFADDDLSLVALLADQAAVILENRALIDESSRVQAREEATRLKDDFLSAAAHDLKTPLTAVVAQAQLLALRAGRDPNAPADQGGIERIVLEAHRLRRLVDDLLDVTRVEQGRLVGNFEQVDLARLVREACTRQTSTQHTYSFHTEERLVGQYDAHRLMQLIDNLLENAAKYSPDSTEIRVSLWREGDDAHLTVHDNGIGIAAEELPHLFERFHRGANVDDRHFAGLGLGLYICRGIVEQHGGRIWATSPGHGRGSTFHVILPTSTIAPKPDLGQGGKAELYTAAFSATREQQV